MKFLAFSFLTVFAASAFAQSSADLTCKAQAKEIAVQTYSNCMTEARNSHIEQIRKNYKDDLAALKAKYDRELKNMGDIKATPAKPNAKSSKKAAPTVKEVSETMSSPKPAKGIARQLPTRKVTRELPIKTVTESDNVENSIIDRESSEAESIDIIPMPEVEEAPAT